MNDIVKTDGLTNSEIFDRYKRSRGIAGSGGLTSIQKQVGFLMAVHLNRKPCPNCGEPHNLPEAAGVTNIDAFDFGNGTSDRVGPCRKCGRTLIFTLPMLGGDWHWRLDPTEAHEKEETK